MKLKDKLEQYDVLEKNKDFFDTMTKLTVLNMYYKGQLSIT